MTQFICNKCYQLMDNKGYEEHKIKKCFPLMLKPMTITLTTTCPVNIVAHLLERYGIKVHEASQDYPSVIYDEIPELEPVIYPSPISNRGFDEFKEEYKNELYSENHNVSGDKLIEDYEESVKIEEVKDNLRKKKG